MQLTFNAATFVGEKATLCVDIAAPIADSMAPHSSLEILKLNAGGPNSISWLTLISGLDAHVETSFL
jgi:hypothetical protein